MTCRAQSNDDVLHVPYVIQAHITYDIRRCHQIGKHTVFLGPALAERLRLFQVRWAMALTLGSSASLWETVCTYSDTKPM